MWDVDPDSNSPSRAFEHATEEEERLLKLLLSAIQQYPLDPSIPSKIDSLARNLDIILDNWFLELVNAWPHRHEGC
jgi:hypothetical protein